MKITKLEKKKRLYLMELDHQQTSYITEDTIVRFMLSRDKVISKEELTEIQNFAQFSYGKNLVLCRHTSLELPLPLYDKCYRQHKGDRDRSWSDLTIVFALQADEGKTTK